MSEPTDKVKELEVAEKELQAKQQEIEASTASLAEKEEKKKALDSELIRVQTDIANAKEERRVKNVTFEQKLRGENLEQAKAKFFSEFKYEGKEDQEKFLEGFKPYDSQSVNPELIYKDMLRAHVAQNPEKYVDLERTVSKLRENGVQFETLSASSAFSGGGGLPSNDSAGLTTEDLRAATWAGIDIPTYKRLKSEGKIE